MLIYIFPNNYPQLIKVNLSSQNNYFNFSIMDKATILAKLKNRFGNLGLSDEMMGAQSDYLLSLTPTAENIDGLVEGMEPVLKSFQSTLDKTRAAAAAKAKPAEPAPAPAPGTPPAAPAGEAVPAWAAGLVSTVNSLQQQLTGKSLSENLVKKLEAEKIPATYYGKFLPTVNFNEEYDEAATVESFKNDFNAFKQAFVNEVAGDISAPIIAPQAQKSSAVKADIERLA